MTEKVIITKCRRCHLSTHPSDMIAVIVQVFFTISCVSDVALSRKSSKWVLVSFLFMTLHTSATVSWNSTSNFFQSCEIAIQSQG